MRIILANHTPIFGSGSGTYTAMLAVELNRVGHEVCVLTPLAEQFCIGPHIETYSVKLDHNFPSFTGHPLSSTTYDDLDRDDLRSLLKAWQDAFSQASDQWIPDVVHVQHAWILAKAAGSVGLNPVVTCHGSEAVFALQHPVLGEFMLPETSQLRAVICISNFVAQEASSILRGAPLTVTLENPYNERLFYYVSEGLGSGDSLHLGFVGRLVSYKNCNQFLECVACLGGVFPNLRASVIGEGAQRTQLEVLANQLGLAKTVQFFGMLDQKYLRSHYQGFDALIVPSENEPFGLVALESVACGTPAIVARNGGLCELVHSPFIIGYENRNMNDLTTAVMQAISQSRAANFGARANDYVLRKYSLTRYVQRLEKIYNLGPDGINEG